MAIAYVGVGSNLGDRQAQIRKALDLLQRDGKVEVLRRSSLYETEPVGVSQQPLFLNAVVQITTDHTPGGLLALLQAIERRMGRERTFRWGPRRIDLDLLLYDDEIIQQPDLVIPHSELANRAFVLVPLVEIAPKAVHPMLRKTMAELLINLGEVKGVRRYLSRGKAKHD